MNRKDLKEYFRILYATEVQSTSKSLLSEQSSSGTDWKSKRKSVDDKDFNIDAQFLAAVISRGMDVLRGIWMEGEETDRVHYMIDNNAPVTDIIDYLRELEVAGKTYKDVEHKYDDLPPDEDEEYEEYSDAGGEIARQQYLDDLAMQGGDWYGDERIENQARYDAKNDSKDVTLYRDNPVYRSYYDEEVGDHSEEYKKMTDSFSPYDK